MRDVLRFTARRYLQGQRRDLAERVDETIELAGLTRLAGRKVGKLSGGERQRLGVAEAWVGRPDVLILDEPSAGLDPEGRHEVLDLLDALREDATIFYSTHILDDIERVSDHIAVLDHGRIVAQGPTESFLVGGVAFYSVGDERTSRRRVRRSGGTTVGRSRSSRWSRTMGGHGDDRMPPSTRCCGCSSGEHGVQRHRLPTGSTQPRGHLPRARRERNHDGEVTATTR